MEKLYIYENGRTYEAIIHASVYILFLYVSVTDSLFQNPHDSIYDVFWCNLIQTSIVASHTWFIAIDAARAAWQVNLHGILAVLVPSHETCVRMGCAPYADHWCVHQGRQVHVGTVHAYHDVEMAHENKFLGETVQLGGGIDHFWVFLCPFVHDGCLCISATKEENAAVWISVDKFLDNFLHLFRRIDFSLVCGKGGDTYPWGSLVAWLVDNSVLILKDMWREDAQVTPFFREDGSEVEIDRVTQLGKYICIVLEGGGLLYKNFVACSD